MSRLCICNYVPMTDQAESIGDFFQLYSSDNSGGYSIEVGVVPTKLPLIFLDTKT